VTCHGHVATIVGNSSHHTLVGTNHRDVIVALAEGEPIHARGGNDLICSRKGGDFIYGDRGADHVFVSGDAYTSSHGGPGDDVLHGGHGPDDLLGGTGADVLHAGGDDEFQDEDAINDALVGGPGRDRIYNDATGNDFPGSGNDFVSRGVLNYSVTAAGVNVDLAAGHATGSSIGRDTLEHITTVFGSRFADKIYGDDNADELVGDAGDNYIDGRGGNDNIEGGGGNSPPHRFDHDTLLGGDGNDIIDASDTGGGPTAMDGGPGDDVIEVPFGDNTIDGGPGADWVEPAVNTDELDGSSWTIDLGAGTMAIKDYTSTVTGVENAEGGIGDDVLRGDDGPNVLIGWAGNDHLYGAGGDDILDTAAAFPDVLYPPQSGDTADGGPGTDSCRATTTTSCESTLTGLPPQP
jgi:Ca2+-binding RTX toxin-like protein